MHHSSIRFSRPLTKGVRLLGAVLLVGPAALPAAAQDFPEAFTVDSPVAERFVRFLHRDDHRTEVNRLWRLHTKAECADDRTPTDLKAELLPTRVVGTLVFGPDDFFPARGTWEERWSGVSCGVPVVVNFSFSTQDGETPPVGAELLPGFTRANFIVQPIVEAAAVTVAGNQIVAAAGDRVDTSCRLNGDVIATVGLLGSAQSALMDRRAADVNTWFEDWTVRLCGCETLIHVGFTQNFPARDSSIYSAPTLSDGSVPSFGQFTPQLIDGFIEKDGVYGIQYFVAYPDRPIADKATADPAFQPPLATSFSTEDNLRADIELPVLRGCPLL